MGLVYVYPAKTFNCVSPRAAAHQGGFHPVTRLLPVFKLRNPKPAKVGGSPLAKGELDEIVVFLEESGHVQEASNAPIGLA